MKNKYLIVLLSALAIACTPDNAEFAFFDDPTIFQPYSTVDDDLSKGIPENPLSDCLNDESTKASYLNITDIAKGLLASNTSRKIRSISGTYWSTDQDGLPIRLSGRIMLPSEGPVRNIILVSHFTIGADRECPSRSFQLEGILALDGYALIISDYIGYGASADRIHPYLCSNLTARNVVDMLDASVPYLEKIGRMPKDRSIYLMGYSQGGATTVAVQRLLESEEYHGKYEIKRNFAGAGPYDIAVTYDDAIKKDYTGIPCAVPLIVIGLNEGEHIGLNMSNFFKSPLLENYPDWILSKKYTTKEMGNIIGVKQVSLIMTDAARQKRDPNTIKFYNAMMVNSTIDNWLPEAPIYMFHSQDDDTVPFLNSQRAKNAFASCNVEYNFGHYGNHQKGCLRFIVTVHEILK
ncbi:MAG: hypothetical protein MJY89_05490 [Bacteroidales bacterium]|nr:hypothetical protein [Bacteroidales bacterium]